MTRDELCLFLGLPVGTALHAVRARVSSVASGDVRLGSTPEKAAALRSRLGLSRSALAIAVLRVCESILRPHPRRTNHLIDLRGRSPKLRAKLTS
jgi:hypothetical protein